MFGNYSQYSSNTSPLTKTRALKWKWFKNSFNTFFFKNKKQVLKKESACQGTTADAQEDFYCARLWQQFWDDKLIKEHKWLLIRGKKSASSILFMALTWHLLLSRFIKMNEKALTQRLLHNQMIFSISSEMCMKAHLKIYWLIYYKAYGSIF